MHLSAEHAFCVLSSHCFAIRNIAQQIAFSSLQYALHCILDCITLRCQYIAMHCSELHCIALPKTVTRSYLKFALLSQIRSGVTEP